MADFPELPCGTIVYRAVFYPGQIKKGKLRWQALKRRASDDDGLSVGLSEEAALDGLNNPVAGMATIHVGKVRDVIEGDTQLNVLQDEDIHALVMGLPYLHTITDDEERVRMEDLETRLCKKLNETAVRLKWEA